MYISLKKSITKSISLLTLITFLFTNISYASPNLNKTLRPAHQFDQYGGRRRYEEVYRIVDPGNIGPEVEGIVPLLEQKVAGIESRGLGPGFEGVSYVSGMSSISAAFFYALEESNVEPRQSEIVLYRPSYACTDNLSDELKAVVKEVKTVMSLEQLQDAVNDNTVFVFFETPTNPSLRIIDIEEFVKIVREKNPNAVVGCDNTFATSLGQQPLKHGVDISMVGLTKGLSASGDVIGAVLIAKKTVADNLREKRGLYSEPLDSLDAFKTVKHGLPLLPMRLEKQQGNAFRYVDYLKDRTNGVVKAVFYPGDTSHPQHDIAVRQMDNYGYMIYFDLGSPQMAKAFMNLIKYTRLFENAVSLGQVRNLIEWPAGGTHATVSPEDREFGGISNAAIRWSVGIEEPEDVLRELECIFSVLSLYKDKLDEIPYDQLNRIFMAKWTDKYGNEEYLLRKFPIVARSGETYKVEPDIEQAIEAIDGRDDADVKTAAGIIHESTRIDKYNPHNLLIHHAWLWGLISGDHRSVTASPGGSTTFRFESAESMQAAFESLGLLKEDRGMMQPGQSQIYTRLGTPVSVTLETLVSLVEVGIEDALSFKYFGFSTPSVNSAIRQVFLNAMFKTPKKKDNKPVKIVVFSSPGTTLDKIARYYQERNFAEFEIVYVNEEGASDKDSVLRDNLDSDVDFVFVDDVASSGLEANDIPAIKQNTQAKIACINTEGFTRGVRPIQHGAYFSIVGLKDQGEDMGAVVVVPSEDASDFTLTRKDSSNTMRDNRAHEALLYVLPYLPLHLMASENLAQDSYREYVETILNPVDIEYAVLRAEEGITHPGLFIEIVYILLDKGMPIKVIADSNIQMEDLEDRISAERFEEFQVIRGVEFIVLDEEARSMLDKAVRADEGNIININGVRVFNVTENMDRERKLRNAIEDAG